MQHYSIHDTMKKKSNILITAVLTVLAAVGFTSCSKEPSLIVSTQNLWFGTEASSQRIEITANCKWYVNKTDGADWYTISPSEGKKDGSVTITVNPMTNANFRESSLMITVPGGHIRRTVYISQNVLDFDGLYNKVFGVSSVEHWNTDYYEQIIEDSYKRYEFDPFDTASGYQMYFLDNGVGAQKDNNGDSTVWYVFHYEFNPINHDLEISFETVDGSPENYAPDVQTASDSLFRFIHEYRPHFWERADMRKIGTINTGDKALLTRKAIKRKGSGPIFQF